MSRSLQQLLLGCHLNREAWTAKINLELSGNTLAGYMVKPPQPPVKENTGTETPEHRQ
jgi:hypothetical protein